MKKISKKLLSLFSVGLLFLNSGVGLVNYYASAEKPFISQSEDLEENEFLGEGGKVYILGERCGNGNEALVYNCIRKEDNGNFVVKISIKDLQCRKFEGKSERDIVLEMLRNSLVAGNDEFQGELTIEHKGPPPAPHKPVCKESQELGLSIEPKRFDFVSSDDDSDDDTDELFGSNCKNKGAFYIGELLGDGSDSKEDVSDADKILVRRCEKNRELSGEKSSSVPVRVYSPKSDEILPSFEKNFSLSKKPTPYEGLSCSGTVNRFVQVALRSKPVRGLVPIASFVPHIEKRFPFTLSKILSGERDLPRGESQLFDWTSNVLDNILEALISLHERDVCHRDVKSDNILLDEFGNAFLGDLGSACSFNEAAQDRMGTRGYMAPEVFYSSSRRPRNPKICDKADVFSLGLVALETLTSDFKAIESLSPGTDFEDYYEQRNKDILSKIDSFHLRSGGKPIPEQWKRFFKACLDPNPETRASAKKAKELLQEAVIF